MQLKEVTGVSKKSGKEWKGYVVQIGEYQTPVFFPSKIELMYIKSIINKQARADFKEELDADTY